MRHILVDKARRKRREKHGGGGHRVVLDDALPAPPTARLRHTDPLRGSRRCLPLCRPRRFPFSHRRPRAVRAYPEAVAPSSSVVLPRHPWARPPPPCPWAAGNCGGPQVAARRRGSTANCGSRRRSRRGGQSRFPRNQSHPSRRPNFCYERVHLRLPGRAWIGRSGFRGAGPRDCGGKKERSFSNPNRPLPPRKPVCRLSLPRKGVLSRSERRRYASPNFHCGRRRARGGVWRGGDAACAPVWGWQRSVFFFLFV